MSRIERQLLQREAEIIKRKQELADLKVDFTEDERQKIRKRSKKDFFYFATTVFKEYFPKPFCRMHKDIKSYAEDYRRIVHLILGPPEHGKTTFFRIYKIYAAIYGLRHYFIKVTETMDLSKIDLSIIRLEFESNPRLRYLFGDLKTPGFWDEDCFHVKGNEFNPDGTWFEAFAFGVPPTGRIRQHYRPDCCDIDDLENYRRSGNVNISKEKLEFINNDIIPRMAEDAPILWFQNNARKTMASNILVEMDSKEREVLFPAFKIHMYPAWDRKRNQPLWFERYGHLKSEEEMRKHFGVGQMTWLGNYMQTPTVPEGTEFKKDNWRTYSKLPEDAIGLMFCDPASGGTGCYKAIEVLFYSMKTRRFYTPEAFVRQCDWEPYFNAMYDLHERYKKHIRFIGWEKDFHQDQFLLFMQLYPSVKDQPPLPIRPIAVAGHGNKEERIRSLAVPYESGQLLFHDDFLKSKDGLEAQMHLIGFPDYPFKDYADAKATAYRLLWDLFASALKGNGLTNNVSYTTVEKSRTSRNMY